MLRWSLTPTTPGVASVAIFPLLFGADDSPQVYDIIRDRDVWIKYMGPQLGTQLIEQLPLDRRPEARLQASVECSPTAWIKLARLTMPTRSPPVLTMGTCLMWCRSSTNDVAMARCSASRSGDPEDRQTDCGLLGDPLSDGSDRDLRARQQVKHAAIEVFHQRANAGLVI